MIAITIHDDFHGKVNPEFLEKIAGAVLGYTDSDESTDKGVNLSIVIESDETLKSLNAQYRQIDKVTDVLSFPADEVDPETGVRYFGDVILSLEQAGKQADKTGHQLEDEVALLVVHGVLHLLGYDHDTPENKQLMWATQRELLDSLGFTNLIIPE